MSLVISRELDNSSLCLAMPLAEPSAEVGLAFFEDMVPPTVFSSGAGRDRRTGACLPDGRRSDQGFIVLYEQSSLDENPRLKPYKSPRSLLMELRRRVAAPPAEHWVSMQITQYRGHRDGRKQRDGFTVDNARHILMIVIDLDGSRMSPMYRSLLDSDWYAFVAALDDLLTQLGITNYRLVRSGPDGVHLYIPLIGPHDKPLRASDKNLLKWRQSAEALCRYLVELGADPNAVRPTQPFVIPGLPRLKHDGWIPYVGGGRRGQRVDLYWLFRRLQKLRLVWRAIKPTVEPQAPGSIRQAELVELMQAIKTSACGVEHGGRNTVAYKIAVALLCKGATEKEAWEALRAWNRRNSPPLPERELGDCLRSAMDCEGRSDTRWREMASAPWNRLRRQLELPAKPMRVGWSRGRWHPITAKKSWEVRKLLSGGQGREHYSELEERLMSHLPAMGGCWEGAQADLADQMGAALSSLKVVLKRLVEAGKITVVTKRGRGGNTVIALPAHSTEENSQSRIAPLGVKTGVWVGPDVSEPVDVPADPVQVVAGVLREFMGVDLHAFPGVPVLAVFGQRGAVRLLARSWPGRELLQALEMAGLVAEIGKRLGRQVLVVLGEDSGDPGPGG